MRKSLRYFLLKKCQICSQCRGFYTWLRPIMMFRICGLNEFDYSHIPSASPGNILLIAYYLQCRPDMELIYCCSKQVFYHMLKPGFFCIYQSVSILFFNTQSVRAMCVSVWGNGEMFQKECFYKYKFLYENKEMLGLWHKCVPTRVFSFGYLSLSYSLFSLCMFPFLTVTVFLHCVIHLLLQQ